MLTNNVIHADTLAIEGIKVIQPFYMEDLRGYFLKWYEKDIYTELGISGIPSEDFETCSRKGVIRGLHFQITKPQAKLVRVVFGMVNDVVVDLRKGSPTFGKHLSLELSGDNHRVLYVPGGFAHGFEVLSETAIMSYKCFGKYVKNADTGICYNSPGLGIRWTTQEPIMTEKDRNLMSFEYFVDTIGGLETEASLNSEIDN